MIVSALILTLTPAGPGPTASGDTPEASPYAEAIVAELARLRDEGPKARDEALERLVGLGPRAVPTVFAVRSGRLAIDQRDGPLLEVEGRTLLLDALRAWPDRRVGELVVGTVDLESPLSEHVTALTLIGAAGDLRSFGSLLDMYSGADPNWMRGQRLQRALQSSLTNILERSPDASRHLGAFLAGTHEDLLPAVATAASACDGDEELSTLEYLLGRADRLDAVVLQCLGDIDLRDAVFDDGERARMVRGYLDSVSPDVRRNAAVTAGRLRDEVSVETLIQMLEDPDARVRRAAHEALREASEMHYGYDPGLWWRWYRKERAWFRQRVPDLARCARTEAVGDAIRAISELSRHRLFGAELAQHLLDAVDHHDPRVAAAACLGIERLGARSAVPGLVEVLLDPRSTVREAASSSLTGLTSLSMRANEWFRWLDDRE